MLGALWRRNSGASGSVSASGGTMFTPTISLHVTSGSEITHTYNYSYLRNKAGVFVFVAEETPGWRNAV